MSIVNRKDFYLHDRPDKEDETRNRLTIIERMGMTEVGIACFGVPGIMSGLYIEMVWSYDDKAFNDYILWASELIQRKSVKPAYVPAVKGGRCWNGGHRDRGHVVHAVEPISANSVGDWFKKALCGTEPGRRSYGWTSTDHEINCSKCKKKLAEINNA